jgi:hypothetical protein
LDSTGLSHSPVAPSLISTVCHHCCLEPVRVLRAFDLNTYDFELNGANVFVGFNQIVMQWFPTSGRKPNEGCERVLWKIFLFRFYAKYHYVQYIMSSTLCPVHYVQCVMSSALCPVRYVQYVMFSTLCPVNYVQYIMSSTLCPVNYVHYIMSSTLCPVHYVRYIMSGTLCPVHYVQ